MAQASLLSYFTRPTSILRHAEAQSGTQPQPSLLEKTTLRHAETTSLMVHPEVENTQVSEAEEQQHTSTVLSRTTICSSHHPLTAIVPVQEDYISALKRLTTVTLPVRYADKFFNTAITDHYASSVSRVALYDAQPVGWIRCRIDPGPESPRSEKDTQPSIRQIYIQALCLLAPYRRCGLATRLLENAVNSPIAQELQATSVYAHVWEDNEDALLWYEKRGFKRVLLVDNYYRRLKPSGAWIVRREIS